MNTTTPGDHTGRWIGLLHVVNSVPGAWRRSRTRCSKNSEVCPVTWSRSSRANAACGGGSGKPSKAGRAHARADQSSPRPRSELCRPRATLGQSTPPRGRVKRSACAASRRDEAARRARFPTARLPIPVAESPSANRLPSRAPFNTAAAIRDKVLAPSRRIVMSIVVRFHPTNMTIAQYDDAVRRHEEAGVKLPPDGMDYHICFGTDGDLRVSEIWDSQEQFQAYGEALMPILADAGIQLAGEPEVFEVHNIVKR